MVYFVLIFGLILITVIPASTGEENASPNIRKPTIRQKSKYENIH